MKKLLLSLVALCATVCSEKTYAQCTATIGTMTAMTVCAGDTVVMGATPAGQPNYQWSINGAPVAGNSSIFETGLTTPGTYVFQVEITDGTSCVAMSNTLTVTVSAPVGQVTVTNNGPVCLGNTLNLSATAANATDYFWTGPNGFSIIQQSPSIPNMQLVNQGVYHVEAVNAACYSNASTMVLVNSNVPAAQTSGAGFCSGDTVTFAPWVTGLSGVTYSWSGPNGFTSTLANPFIQNAQLLHSGVYTMTVTGTGCSGLVTITDTANIIVDTAPTVSLSNNGPLCIGSTLQLSSTITGATSFVWHGPNSFMSSLQNPVINNIQPSQGGYYYVNAFNGACVLTTNTYVAVTGNTPTLSTYSSGQPCVDDSLTLYAYAANLTGVTYQWNGPNGFTSTQQSPFILSAQLVNSGTYTVTATGMTCGNSQTLSATETVNVIDCDSVWPGDANHDYIANYWDILDLGVLYGLTGPARIGANNNWTAQYCADWGNAGPVDNKHADCNGDGNVDGNDTTAVYLNYGLWHNKGAHVPQAKSAGIPDLYFDMTGIALGAGGTVTIPIKFGTTTVPMNDVYGIAAQVKISGIIPTNPMTVSGSISWMGNTANAIDFSKDVSNEQTDWAFVRTDHSNVSGDGTIGLLTFTVPAGTEYQLVDMYFENVKVINKDGVELTDYNVIDQAALVYPLSVNNTQVINSISILPNPSDAHAELQLSLAAAADVQIVITDMAGRTIWSVKRSAVAGTQNIVLPATQAAPGMYMIQVRDDKGAISKSMKWIKK